MKVAAGRERWFKDHYDTGTANKSGGSIICYTIIHCLQELRQQLKKQADSSLDTKENEAEDRPSTGEDQSAKAGTAENEITAAAEDCPPDRSDQNDMASTTENEINAAEEHLSKVEDDRTKNRLDTETEVF